jgi:hypothetical protein
MPSDEPEPRLRSERTVPLNVPIPYLLRERLDGLKKRLEDADADAKLYEIVAMLIFHAQEDKTKLRELYEKYRSAPPEAAAFKGESGDVIPFRRRSRGRPNKSSR